MEGTYPIIIGDKHMGEVKVTKDGLMTRFEAQCADRGELLRISVYGEEGEGYLGVMVPENGRLVLRKSLSRNALAAFPRTITHASEAGLQGGGATPGLEQIISNPDWEEAVPEADDMPPDNAEQNPEPAWDEAVPAAENLPPGDNEHSPAVEAEAAPFTGSLFAVADEAYLSVPATEAKAEAVIPEAVDVPAVMTAGQAEALTPGESIYEYAEDREAEAKDPEDWDDKSSEAEDNIILGEETSEPPMDDSGGEGDTIWIPTPNPWSLVSSAIDKADLSEVRGALTTQEAGLSLLAVPAESSSLARSRKPREIRSIEGDDYAIYELKDGRIM